jgi:hypothetical protein
MIAVVDLSQYQGDVDFAVMRAKGVRGLILRASHGLVADTHAAAYYAAARAAGFEHESIGWYSFVNPKRGSGQRCAEFFASTVLAITAGVAPAFVMLDIESYRNESPNVGTEPVRGRDFTSWIMLHLATLATVMPATRRIGYTNAAYWNPAVGDVDLAASLEWIVPRYPAYSSPAYARHPLPPDASGWETWATATGVQPNPPAGARGWAGWQFSAGFNGQGAIYGCGSSDLDLNIVRDDAWARWTSAPAVELPSPKPPQEDDMSVKLIRPDGDAAVLAVSGLTASWAVSGEVITDLQGAGLLDTTPVQVVPRRALRALHYRGPLPSYDGVGPDLPGRTSFGDFATYEA